MIVHGAAGGALLLCGRCRARVWDVLGRSGGPVVWACGSQIYASGGRLGVARPWPRLCVAVAVVSRGWILSGAIGAEWGSVEARPIFSRRRERGLFVCVVVVVVVASIRREKGGARS
jgi:hypothetical protein